MLKNLGQDLTINIENGILTTKLDLIHYSYGYLLKHATSFRKVFELIDELYIKYNLARA